MKHTKTLFLIGIILIILPFTGLSLTVKNWLVVALGVWVIGTALVEQIVAVAGERQSSYKKVSVESQDEHYDEEQEDDKEI